MSAKADTDRPWLRAIHKWKFAPVVDVVYHPLLSRRARIGFHRRLRKHSDCCCTNLGPKTHTNLKSERVKLPLRAEHWEIPVNEVADDAVRASLADCSSEVKTRE